MRIQSAVFVNDQDRRQLVGSGTGRPDEVTLDRSVAVRRRNRFARRLQPRVVRLDLLRLRIVRHQLIDDGGGGDGGDGHLLHPVHEGAAVDLAVDIEVVGVDRLTWELLIHKSSDQRCNVRLQADVPGAAENITAHDLVAPPSGGRITAPYGSRSAATTPADRRDRTAPDYART